MAKQAHRPAAMVATDAGESRFAVLPNRPAIMAHTVSERPPQPRARAHTQGRLICNGRSPVVVCGLLHGVIDPALHRADQAFLQRAVDAPEKFFRLPPQCRAARAGG